MSIPVYISYYDRDQFQQLLEMGNNMLEEKDFKIIDFANHIHKILVNSTGLFLILLSHHSELRNLNIIHGTEIDKKVQNQIDEIEKKINSYSELDKSMAKTVLLMWFEILNQWKAKKDLKSINSIKTLVKSKEWWKGWMPRPRTLSKPSRVKRVNEKDKNKAKLDNLYKIKKNTLNKLKSTPKNKRSIQNYLEKITSTISQLENIS